MARPAGLLLHAGLLLFPLTSTALLAQEKDAKAPEKEKSAEATPKEPKEES